jgi:serine/threonine protein phosphatase PrpC
MDPAIHAGYHFPPSKAENEQDRMFMAHSGPYTLIGLANGHGQTQLSAGLVKFVADEMPRAIFRSRYFVKGDVVTALHKAFHRVHRKGIEQVDCRFSGAAVTVLLFCPETVWVAYVGDCKVVLGVPDSLPNAKEYHFTPVTLTKEHRLAMQGEFDRIVRRQGEVRRLTNDHSHRIFVKNEDFPGLTLSRAIGDRVGHQIGVIHQPSIGQLQRADLEEGAFFALASGGLWSTMAERTVVNWVGKNFDNANVAARCLVEEAMKRWADPGRDFHRGPEPDCFSALVLFPSAAAPDENGARSLPMASRRAFAVGSHQQDTGRTWKQIKAVMKLMSLRKAMDLDGEDGGHDEVEITRFGHGDDYDEDAEADEDEMR